ncbi:hypothetical protein MTO96_036459 [Rhipicephalus appendiculatus]
MKIGCLRSKQFPDGDMCTLYSYLFDIFRAKNVSLEYRNHSHWSTLFDDLYCANIDMVALVMPIKNILLASSTYSDVILLPETFYAQENEMEAPSLYDTTLRSASAFAVTAASLIICVGLLLLIGGPHVYRRAQTETLFLLALFLARSTPFPNATRWPRVQYIVYLFWALAMLPLSQYFQGELTSLVTVGRPCEQSGHASGTGSRSGRRCRGTVRPEGSGQLVWHREHRPSDDARKEAARIALEKPAQVGNWQRLTLLFRMCQKEW